MIHHRLSLAAIRLEHAHQPFADLLRQEVGPGAFEEGAQREMYELVMLLSAQVECDKPGAVATYGKVTDLLGLKPKNGEKLSATLARTLAEEARRELAQSDGPARQRADHWTLKERQRKEARAQAARQLTT